MRELGRISCSSSDGLSLSGVPVIDPRQRAQQLSYLSQTQTSPALALGRFPFGGRDLDGRNETIMDQLALGALADRHFIGREQARVLLGRTLAVNAPVLLVDEPIASIDPHYALHILDALRGRIIIVSLHDLVLTQRYCNAAILLHDGKIVSQGSVETALTPDILRGVFRIRLTPEGFEPQ